MPLTDLLTMTTAADPLDLVACDREPIHLPGSIQPHGLLLVLREPDHTVLQASANTADLLGVPGEQVLGASLSTLLGQTPGERLAQALAGSLLERYPQYLQTLSLTHGEARTFHAVAHRNQGLLILELEHASPEQQFQSVAPLGRDFVAGLQSERGAVAVSELAARAVRRLTGFDRVLIYRFDPDWHGTVLAEDRAPGAGALPSYLDLRFPASDIPQQARELYRLNHLRLIADVAYSPVPIVPALHPATHQPLDLSFAVLRSVSPIHLEYLRNMGVGASMSISILRGGRLWGLIACHHRSARRVPFDVRTACDFLGQVFSLHLEAEEGRAEYENRIRLKAIQWKLLAFMAGEENFVEGLARHPQELLDFASAVGAAILFGGKCTLVGQTPGEAAVRQLVRWLAERPRAGQGGPSGTEGTTREPRGEGEGALSGPGEDVFHTDSLSTQFPDADWQSACGVLAIAISKLHRSYLVWFRPEVVQTVRWAGDPSPPPSESSERLHPRRSFETWKELVRGHSTPWRPSEIETVLDLRNDIVGIVLRKAEEMAALSAELLRSNQELEAFSYSISHDLRAPFRHIVGYAELLEDLPLEQAGPEARHYLNNILEAGQYAGTLVDHLLNFSRMGRTTLSIVEVDLNELVREVQESLSDEVEPGREVAWVVHPLPRVKADLLMLRQVIQNLLSNAIKYTRPRAPARIEIQAEVTPAETIVTVRDNGVGFDMRYVDKLFGVFQRLHRIEEFEGTGIGLANVWRIITRHRGRVWAEGQVNAGATFWFSLPREGLS